MADTDFDLFGASDLGKKRSENQDHFLIASMRRQLVVDQTDVPAVQHEQLFIVHAGDSRCYLLRDNQIKQLTTDHTIAQQLIDTGSVQKDDQVLSRWRHVLWNCVGGTGEAVRPEAIRCQRQQQDTILLSSDGLTGMVGNQEIASIVASATDSEDATKNLIEAANQAGGKDNVSVVVCKVGNPPECDDEEDAPGTSTTIIE